MSVYGSIGFTRRDKAPKHWKADYRLTPKTKKEINELKTERERLIRELENLPIEISDEEYTEAQRIVQIKLNELIIQEDRIRQTNLK